MQHIINITDKCNLNCPYCHSKRIRGVIKNKSELIGKLEELKKKGIKKIDFSGGEPTLVKDLAEYIRLARKYVDTVGILTNGLMISNNRILQDYVENGMNYIYLTIYDIKEKNCNEICGGNYDLKKLFKTLKNLKKTNLFVNIGIVINNTNKDNLLKITKEASNILGKDRIRVEISYIIMAAPIKEAKRFLLPSEILSKRTVELTDYLDKEGIPHCITSCFGPFCLVRKRIEKFMEFREFIGDKEARMIRGNIKKNKSIRVKIESCKKCVFNYICDGIFKGNLILEGSSNYRPITFQEILS